MEKTRNYVVLFFLMIIGSVSAAQTQADIVLEKQLLQIEKQIDNRFNQHEKMQVKATKGAGTASISGTVRDSVMSPVENMSVYLYSYDAATQARSFVDSAVTGAAGTYNLTALNAGVYFLTTRDQSSVGYISLIWNPSGGAFCSNCEVQAENIITLGVVDNTINDFTVTVGGKISGVMSDAVTATGVATQFVQANNSNFYSDQTTYDGVGGYEIRGLPDGDYQVYTQPDGINPNQHIPQLYGFGECNASNCRRLASDTAGTPVTIAAAASVAGINFAMNVGASISGRLLDETTLAPVDSNYAFFLLFNDINQLESSQIIYGLGTDPTATGEYFIGGLLPGDYFLQADGRDYYIREVYDNIHCPWTGCNRSGLGAPLSLLPQQNRINVNFLLQKGGKLSGAIQDAAGVNIAGEGWVQVHDASGNIVGGGSSRNLDGNYELAKAIPPGDYIVRSGSMWAPSYANTPYIDERYNGTACPGETCDLSTANTLVNVAANATTPGIDFTLEMGFEFSGVVTDLVTGTPIADAYVLAYDATGAYAASARTDALGAYTVTGLPAGTYYALTNNGSRLPFMGLFPTSAAGWVDILYSNIPCPGGGCDVTSGTPISVPARGGNIDFSLVDGATISGRVVYEGTQAPIPNCLVEIFDGQGDYKGGYYTNEQGYYQTVGLPSGSYYLRTRNPGFLLDEVFGGQYCLNGQCDPLIGGSVGVTAVQDYPNNDFALKTDYLFSDQF